MTAAELRQALRAGRTVIGTLISSPSPFWPKMIHDCGLDFAFIDTEHIALNRESVSWMCRTYSAMGIPPVVRITDQNPNQVTVALDDGAAGVIAPYVETPEAARQLTGATKYRPLKGDRLASVLGGEALPNDLGQYVGDRSQDNILILNIESRPAIDALDEILDVEGIDGVLIGPHDLTTSLGIPEQYEHPDFLRACETIFQKARARGLGAGIHAWFAMDAQVRLMELGANMLIHKGDVIFFRQALLEEMGELRERLGVRQESSSGDGVSI